jgi:hypothetical protein
MDINKLKELFSTMPDEDIKKFITKIESVGQIRREGICDNVQQMWTKAGTEARIAMIENAMEILMQCLKSDSTVNIFMGNAFIELATEIQAGAYLEYYAEQYKKIISPDNEELERMMKL